MNHSQMKLENPVRLTELKPEETLKRIGLQEYHVLCDIGAGSGIFTIPAANITKNKVYALETNEELLSVIAAKAKAEGLSNLEPVKVTGDNFNLEDATVDIVLLVTVLHEISEKTVFLREVKRILKAGGKMAVIEFNKSQTPIGPPQEHRMRKDEVMDNLTKAGLVFLEGFGLGDNFYCVVFQK